MKLFCAYAAFALLLGAAPVQAESLRPFVPGSAAQIRASHSSQPYIIALWSLSCTHCVEELVLLGRLKEKYPALDLVLVSTDTPDEQPALADRLAQHRLMGAEQWVFADAFSERLRFEIDPRWQGELPRSYLVGRDGAARAVSGRLDGQTIEIWLAAQSARP